MSLDTNPVGKGYALWLTPIEPMFSRLAGEIRQLSLEYSTPRFDPHVTLLGGIMLREEDALARSAALSGMIEPFQMELANIDHLDEYFRCLFVRVTPTGPILSAHQAAVEAFGMSDDSPYTPHVSLLYGKLGPETRTRITSSLGSLSGKSVRVKSLDLYRVFGPLSEWKRVASFELAKIAKIK